MKRENIKLKLFGYALVFSFIFAGCENHHNAVELMETTVDEEKDREGQKEEKESGHGADEPVSFSNENMEKWIRYSLRYKIKEGEVITEEILSEMNKFSIYIEDEAEQTEIRFLKEDMERLTAVDTVCMVINPEVSGEWISGYENLKYIPNLETVWIEDQAIEDFSFLQECSGLKNVTVLHNALPENFLDHCRELERVQIYECTLPENLLRDCPNLKDLTISGSKIENPDIFLHLTELEEISMDKTELDQLEFVRGMKKLKNLSVRDNRIQDISPVFDLPCLEELYINDNELADFELQKLPDSLLWLAIAGNPNVTLTSEMFTQYSVVELWHDKERNLEMYAEELRQSQKVFNLHSLEGQWTDIAAEGDIVFGELTDDSKCEIDDCFVGDMDGDGVDDLGVVVNAVDEYGPCGRWLYIYPKEEKGYGKPYEPIALWIPLYSGAAWSDGVSGAVICDGKLIIQQVSGTSSSCYYTDIYCYDQNEWKKEHAIQTAFSFCSDGIIQTITDCGRNWGRTYMYGRNESGTYERVCTENHALDENLTIGMPVFSMEYTEFRVYDNLREMPFSTTEALEAVMEKYFSEVPMEKVSNDSILVENYEKIFGIKIPDYYYLVQTQKGLLAVHFEDWTKMDEEREAAPMYEIIAEYYDAENNCVTDIFQRYIYNSETGEEEPQSAFQY